jgi:transcription elongation factor Elf1
MKMFRDKFKCPKCKAIRVVMRRGETAGKKVATYCQGCGKDSIVTAGAPKV